ncbi:MAG: hypothetical protein ACK5EW_03940 [Bacteroidota bacterium]|jgi:hypothetical protein
MKKILTILTLILLFSQVNAQIKSVEIKGSSVLIVGVNNQKKAVYILQNAQETFLGHNSNYWILKRGNNLLVMDTKGSQFSIKPITLSKSMEFLKITDKSIWILDGSSKVYYDFKGSRLSNYSE